jgi:hypothetical protein
MKSMWSVIKKAWSVAEPLALPVIACGVLPVCLAAVAGLGGLGIVAALDVWADLYFVDGVPVAAAFIILVSLLGFWLLQSPSEASFRARFVAGFKQAKAALHLADPTYGVSVSDTFNAVRQIGKQNSDQATSDRKSNSTDKIDPRAKSKLSPLIHSVAWGKPIHRSHDLNCSITLETNKNYDARK